MPIQTHPARARVQEIADMHDEEVILIDGHDDAIIGTGDAGGLRVFYSIEKIIKTVIKRDGMSHDEASEFFSYNIERAFSSMSKGSPIFIEPLQP